MDQSFIYPAFLYLEKYKQFGRILNTRSFCLLKLNAMLFSQMLRKVWQIFVHNFLGQRIRCELKKNSNDDRAPMMTELPVVTVPAI